MKPKNTAGGSLSFLQWIFPIQESNQQVDYLPTELSGKPAKEWNWTPVSLHKKKKNKKNKKKLKRIGDLDEDLKQKNFQGKKYKQ